MAGGWLLVLPPLVLRCCHCHGPRYASLSPMLGRRTFVMGMSAAAVGVFFVRRGHAATVRALSLAELVATSRCAVVGTPVEMSSTWETIGKRRRIVTYVSVQVERALDGRSPDSDSLTVRLLGGRVGDIGQIVPGEAALPRGERAGLFLSEITSGVFQVNGLAQGHYPLRPDTTGEWRLRRSPQVSDLMQLGGSSAVERLDGRTIVEAERLIVTELFGNAK